ncbi:MAG: hypothetical protein L6Q38_06195, partial [Nitrospira sp.]|nr:hypothetical protein [Nitrospira sp.]
MQIMHATLCGPGGEPPDAPTHWTEREYVWGPGYADDCLAQFGRENTPFFVLNDPHGTVLAITDAAGNVAEQYAWQPYGRLEVAESLLPHPVNRLGLHGMFFDHFVAGSDGRVLTPASEGLFHARNRHYHPRLGRFIQRDPNETGQPLLTALAFNGQTLSILVGGFDVQSLYGDGPNLYAAFGSNPIGNSDPLGLSWGIEDDVDEAIANYTAEVIGFVAALGSYISTGLDIGLLIGEFAFAMNPVGGAVMAGLDLWRNGLTLTSVGSAVLSYGGRALGLLSKVTKIVRGYRKNRAATALANAVGLTDDVAEHLFKIMPARKARELTKGKGGAIIHHHILERRFAKAWGYNPDDVPAVILPKEFHDRTITSQLHSLLPTR